MRAFRVSQAFWFGMCCRFPLWLLILYQPRLILTSTMVTHSLQALLSYLQTHIDYAKLRHALLSFHRYPPQLTILNKYCQTLFTPTQHMPNIRQDCLLNLSNNINKQRKTNEQGFPQNHSFSFNSSL